MTASFEILDSMEIRVATADCLSDARFAAAKYRGTIRHTATGRTVPALPSSVAGAIAAAASMFTDPAVVSVNVETTFGEVTVARDGRVTLA